MGAAATGARNTNAFAGAALRGTRLPAEDSITYEGVFNENVYKLDPADPAKLISTEAYYARSLNPATGTLEAWIGCFIKSNRDGAPRDDTPIDIAVALDISESMIIGMGMSKASLFEQRLFREGAETGPVQFSLIWNTRDDLDLHCFAPGGEEISYSHRESACGGKLDVDMNAGQGSSQEPVENIFWSRNPPTGHFQVFVQNYSYKQTLFGEPIPFTLRLKFPQQELFFEGKCAGEHGESNVSFDFDYTGPAGIVQVKLNQRSAEPSQKVCSPVHIPDLTLYTGRESRLLYAKQCIEKILDKLRPDDRIGIAAFTETPTRIRPLLFKSELNASDVMARVNELQPVGGTTLQAGMEAAASMFTEAASLASRHKRIMLITDMDDMKAHELDGMVKAEAKRGIYCSIVGLGVDFNSKLAEAVSKNRGANYFTVTTPDELEKTIVTDFQWTFFPCAFDVHLDLISQNLGLVGVYGTPYDTSDVIPTARWKPTIHQFYPEVVKKPMMTLLLCTRRQKVRLPLTAFATIMNCMATLASKVTEINTVFPSHATSDGSVEGGLILMRFSVQPDETACAARLALTYTNPATDATELCTQAVPVDLADGVEYYSNESMIQAVLLQRYVETCKTFLKMAAGLDWTHPVPSEEVRKLEHFKHVLHSNRDSIGEKVVDTYENFLKTTAKFIKDQNEAAEAAAAKHSKESEMETTTL